MIWYFLMGMIAGAGCLVLFAHRWMTRHTTILRMEEDEDDDGHPNENVSGD